MTSTASGSFLPDVLLSNHKHLLTEDAQDLACSGLVFSAGILGTFQVRLCFTVLRIAALCWSHAFSFFLKSRVGLGV